MEKLTVPGVLSTPSSENLMPSKARRILILQCTLAIFTAYRLDQYGSADHAEGFKANLKAVLGQYPDEVIIHISDPRTGVQRANDWPPSINKIVCACEVQMQHMAKLARLRTPPKRAEPKLLETPRENRPSLEELKAKYGENWGLALAPMTAKKPSLRTKSWAEVIAEYRSNPERLTRLMRVADDYAADRGEAPA